VIRLAAAAWSGGAGVAAGVTCRAAVKIVDRCTPDQGCRYPRWCHPAPRTPRVTASGM